MLSHKIIYTISSTIIYSYGQCLYSSTLSNGFDVVGWSLTSYILFLQSQEKHRKCHFHNSNCESTADFVYCTCTQHHILFEHIYKDIFFAPFRIGKLILYESITIIEEKPSYWVLNTYSRKAIILGVEYYVHWAFISFSYQLNSITNRIYSM